MSEDITSLGKDIKDRFIESGIWGHIDELRVRLFSAIISLAITTFASFLLTEQLIHLIAEPAGGIENLQAIEVTETLGVFMRVSLLSGFILALPFILYQILSFVLPGLKRSEKKWIFLAIPTATILFVAGAAFTYTILLPTALPFLMEFMEIETTPRLSNYINFVTSMIFWVGVSFEAPLVVFVLAKLQLITAKTLLKQWRIAIVVIAILAALITPTGDPVNMGLLMLPLTGIYLLSVLFAAIAGSTGRDRKKRTRKKKKRKK